MYLKIKMLPLFFGICILSLQVKFNICSDPPLIRIPLVRMKTPFHRMLEVGVNPENIFYTTEGRLKPPQPPRTNDSIPIYKFLDTEFYAAIGVGHPAQPVNVIFDTTWGDSWVTSSKCPFTCFACTLKRKFDDSKSVTFVDLEKNFNISLGNSKLKGFLVNDTIYFPHINVTNQTFGEVTSLPLSYIFSEADGVIGLGAPNLSRFQAMPIMYNMIRQKKIQKPVFSIFFNKLPETYHGGSIFFGGSDPKHYNGSFTRLRITDQFYWMFPVQKIELRQYPKRKLFVICPKGCSAMADSSTNVITGPADDIMNINLLLGATKFMFGKYLVPCNMVNVLPHISFIIGGRNFTLTGPDYIQQIGIHGFEICLSAFVQTDLPSPYNKTWTFGGAFLGAVYTEFNFEDNVIGFATKR